MKERSLPDSEIISNSPPKAKFPMILIALFEKIRFKGRNKQMKKQLKCSARLIGAFASALAVGMAAQPARADDSLTERNKSIVRDFYTTVLIGRDVDAAPRFLRPDYIQGNPGNNVPTGLKGFMDTFRERFSQKLPPDY